VSRSTQEDIMKNIYALSAALLLAAGSFGGCSEAPDPGEAEAAHTDNGSCADACGGLSDDGCWCDAECVQYGDCCGDKALVCDGCSEGEIVLTSEFEPSTDDKQCAVEIQHCVTNDGGACPQFSPLPPGYCPNGEVVQGSKTHVPSADGMECELPSVHCVTNDSSACPLFSPLPPDFCSDGEIVQGESSFIPSTDDMECQLPSVHCVTTNASSCGTDSCEHGQVKLEQVFVDASAGLSCVEEVSHCLTNDFGACPQFSPLPPNYCPDGRIVSGPPSYIQSADSKECELPSVHCVTNDWDACPLFQPLPPNYCEGGEVMQGPTTFISSVDGMECEIPSVHCVEAESCG
jgi:hypothetical protein